MKINKILNKSEVSYINSLIEKLQFIDGKISATGQAQKVKNNSQANPVGDIFLELHQYIQKILHESSWIKNRFFPKQFSTTMINKYSAGESYGRHMDSSHIQTSKYGILRRDFSYTLMLSDKDNYDGGELKIENPENINQTIKLDSGDIVIYPSNRIHSVLPVTQGERIAFVGWISSYIKTYEGQKLLDSFNDLQLALAKYNLSDDDQLLISHLKNNLIHSLSD
jgi:PKHD-type hydroxylase